MNPILLNTLAGILLSASAFSVSAESPDIVNETVKHEPILETAEDSNVDEYLTSIEDIELIALITMAEAEGECEEGKRLVIDSILNRVDSELYPDNIYDVIYQPSHFSSVWNGRIECCEVQDDICGLVIEEMKNRYNEDVIFFNADDYSEYGIPMFKVGNHYFSSCG